MSSADGADVWPPLETAQSTLLFFIGITAGIVPLGLPAIFLLLLLITFAQKRFHNGSDNLAWHRLKSNPSNFAALAFIAFAFLSSTWSADPLYAAKSVAPCGLLFLGTFYVAAALDEQARSIGEIRRNRFIRSLPLALTVVALYFGLNAVTADALTLFFANNYPWMFEGSERAILYTTDGVAYAFMDFYFDRSAAALVMIGIGAIAALRFWPRPSLGTLLAISVVTGLVLICLRSGSATALLAAIAACGAFALALWSSHKTLRLLQATFLLFTLAAIPLSMLPKKVHLDTDLRLPHSFRERAIIWNDLSHLALTAPWFGIGAKSIKRLTHWPKQMAGENKPTKVPSSYVHPHNGYLQVWVEMGGFGALLFALAGTLLMGRTKSLPPMMQPYVLALAAGTMALIGPGWELWQPWLIAAIGSGWIGLLVLSSRFEEVETI